MMNVKIVSVDELKPYEKNAKKHSQTQIDNVAESIKQFGIVQPIVIDKNNVIVIGHCRILACKKLGIEQVPCVRVDDLTEEQVKTLRVVDNKTNESEWDMNFLTNELKDVDLSSFDFNLGIGDGKDEIDWKDVEDLSEKTYDEPQHKMLECPACHHVDRDIHFKVVSTNNK